jgi:hypothetical protein
MDFSSAVPTRGSRTQMKSVKRFALMTKVLSQDDGHKSAPSLTSVYYQPRWTCDIFK